MHSKFGLCFRRTLIFPTGCLLRKVHVGKELSMALPLTCSAQLLRQMYWNVRQSSGTRMGVGPRKYHDTSLKYEMKCKVRNDFRSAKTKTKNLTFFGVNSCASIYVWMSVRLLLQTIGFYFIIQHKQSSRR